MSAPDASPFPERQGEILHTMETARNYNAWLLDRARPYLGRRVLDAGAGTGTFVERLLEEGREVVAVEPDPALLPELRRRFGDLDAVRILETELRLLPDQPDLEPVDAAICFNVLEHIPDHVAALRGIRSLLRPGGALCALVPAHPLLYGEIDRAVGHVRRYTRAALSGALGAAGFEVRELRHVNPVGALGWLVSSRILRRNDVPQGGLRLYDRLVPVLRAVDALRTPVGLSVWAVAVKPERGG